ncbi:MAG: hypothetical protein HWE27_14205 [Gammaproteobacteria bacterium]|nr:hypothetical protein [Gammaproteobacteria bacterium]
MTYTLFSSLLLLYLLPVSASQIELVAPPCEEKCNNNVKEIIATYDDKKIRKALINDSTSIYYGKVVAIIEEQERLITGDSKSVLRAFIEIEKGWKKPKERTIKIDQEIKLKSQSVLNSHFSLKPYHTYLFFENRIGIKFAVLMDNPKDPSLGYQFDFKHTDEYRINVKYIEDLGKPDWLYSNNHLITMEH